jgi:hypothetical protein
MFEAWQQVHPYSSQVTRPFARVKDRGCDNVVPSQGYQTSHAAVTDE